MYPSFNYNIYIFKIFSTYHFRYFLSYNMIAYDFLVNTPLKLIDWIPLARLRDLWVFGPHVWVPLWPLDALWFLSLFLGATMAGCGCTKCDMSVCRCGRRWLGEKKSRHIAIVQFHARTTCLGSQALIGKVLSYRVWTDISIVCTHIYVYIFLTTVKLVIIITMHVKQRCASILKTYL